MNILKYKDYEGTCEIDTENDVCHGKLLFIEDLITYEAETPKQLKIEFEAAVDDYIDTCAELGIVPKKALKGQFNVRVSPELHKAAVRRSYKDSISLNEVVKRALEGYLYAAQPINNHFNISIVGEEPISSVPSAQPQWYNISSTANKYETH
ncbi:MAG: type II toxin-antitoxin system HicB family antitoxin [Gammaproteobacteria bacterium]